MGLSIQYVVMSRYLKICQDICQDMSRYLKICQDICQDMSRYLKIYVKIYVNPGLVDPMTKC